MSESVSTPYPCFFLLEGWVNGVGGVGGGVIRTSQ